MRRDQVTKILGTLITQCGAQRLLFASGNNLGHPAPLLEAFRDFQFSDKLRSKLPVEDPLCVDGEQVPDFSGQFILVADAVLSSALAQRTRHHHPAHHAQAARNHGRN